MSDKPLVQQALASELADLLLLITSTPSSLAFLKGFWETIVREWNGIDRLRFVPYHIMCLIQTDPEQNGQVLHAYPTFRKCFLPSPHSIQLGVHSRIQYNSNCPGRSSLVSLTTFCYISILKLHPVQAICEYHPA